MTSVTLNLPTTEANTSTRTISQIYTICKKNQQLSCIIHQFKSTKKSKLQAKP